MTTAFVLFNVTVPARIVHRGFAANSLSERTEGVIPSETEYLSLASTVRNFIVNDSSCEWISEEPFVNGKAWWVTFEFSCNTAYTETCIGKLQAIGVGDEEDGRGSIHVSPVFFRHIGSRPHAFGRPDSLPYGAPITPHQSPLTPSLRKKPLEANSSADAPDSPVATASSTDKSAVTFSDEEYHDGAEVEDEADRLRANLIAEVEASERTQDLRKYTENFAETVHSRVAVDALVQYVTAASEFSFDYVMLCIIAAIIACVGLVTNNQVVIVASMLVSPLMGPILAETLGSVLSDYELIKRGVFAEGVGLTICLVVGFIGGLCAAPTSASASWPTEEMESRAVASALYIGVAIAIPSGAGAALSVMGSNTSSLVGVAISASLLPPVVNSGVLFAAASLKNTDLWRGDEKDYPHDNPVFGALISFGVTLINIICIFIAAYLMFEFKEVRGTNTFWKEDVKGARKYNKAVRKDSRVRSAYEKAFISFERKPSTTGTEDVRRRRNAVYVTPLEKLRASWRAG